MRLSFFFALVLSTILGAIYWYQLGAHLCPVPLSYRLGQLDSEFNLTAEMALKHIAAAEAVFEAATGRELFVYDEQAKFRINFIFDERQAQENSESVSRVQLDRLEADNAELQKTIEEIRSTLATSEGNYTTQVTVYGARLAEYNAEVQRYNDRGGAPPEVFRELETTRRELDVEVSRLRAIAVELRITADNLTDLSTEANRKIAEYNRQVNRYNQEFVSDREFTQGDYQREAINIYTFSDEIELITVLAHEFGHALGLGHVEGNDSVMYYLMTERTEVPTLSETDKAAFIATCGPEETWEQRLRARIRTLIESISN